MNELMIFKNPELGEIRTVLQNGEPWFVLKDVCLILGIGNTSDVYNRLDTDEKGVGQIDTLGGAQRMNIINESGLYSVILRSDKPEAKPFRKWVTSEVLPAIRKTGTYSVNQADSTKQALAEAKLNNSRARMSSMWLKIASIVSVPEYKDVCASYASSALAGKEVLPLPECNEHLYTATEIGQMFGGIDKARIGKIANQNGLKSAEYGKTVWDKSPYSSKQVETFRYNQKAVERFSEILGVPGGV